MLKLPKFIPKIIRGRRSETSRDYLRYALVTLSVLALLAAIVWTIRHLPIWQAEWTSFLSTVAAQVSTLKPAESGALFIELLKLFVQVLGGSLVLFGLYLSFRRVKVTEQGHITDRYSKAIELLGAVNTKGEPNIEVRLGAIYALERIAFDSPRDHWTIMEVLTAYVRQNAPWQEIERGKEENKKKIDKGPDTEIQAILTVLGRRKRGGKREKKGQRLDLSGADLRGADFGEAHLEDANFYGAHVEGAYFYGAHVEGASFSEAHLEGAIFNGAHVQGASFSWAHIGGANFYEAHVEGAYFNRAHLEGAIFVEAHVEGANFIAAHLEGANFDVAHVEGAIFGAAQVEGAKFWNAIGLEVGQFDSAEGLEKARFEDEFTQKLKSAGRLPPDPESDAAAPVTPPSGRPRE